MLEPLNPDTWRHIRRLFERALERPAEERHAWLERSEPDGGVRSVVARMLSRDASGEGLPTGDVPGDAHLGELVRKLGASLPNPQEGEAELRGRRMGPYRLVRLLGRGGMGAVYLAERADGQFEQRVAVKLLPLGMDSAEARRRFLAERQLLAGLEHPNIARLLDGGIAEDGTPYFVMERVVGRPIHRYCDAERLRVRERLELFLQVCQAVQYAHQKLVVHRDLKPSNILVTPDGSVKLLDFGIAKLLSDDPNAARTRTGARVMTPRYAAPEQLRGDPVSTATDVYALGVLLCELLAGAGPYTLSSTDALETERAILEKEPRRPSAAVAPQPAGPRPDPGKSADDGREIAAARRTTPAALRRRLRGDLDNIVLKALEKDPARRYQSARELEEDLRRHLEGRPIVARPPGRAYRAAKFVGRHRLGLVAASIAALALLGGSAVAVWQGRAAARERDAARAEADKAARIADFLVGIFEAPDPYETLGDSLTVREVLDRGRRRVEVELEADPARQAALMDVMARTYLRLDAFDEAWEIAAAALERRRRLYGDSHPEVAVSLATAAAVAQSRGERGTADSLYRATLALREAILGPDHPDVAEALTDLAQLMGAAAAMRDTAEALHRRALAIVEGGAAAERLVAAKAMNNLALLLHQRLEGPTYEEAERLYQEAVAIQRELLGDRHPETLTSLSNLAWLRQATGDYEGAARAHREILEARREVHGPRHYRVALSLGALAEVLYLQGDYGAAVPLNREAHAIRGGLLPAEHGQVLYTLHMLARSLAAAGALEEADSLYREGMARARRAGEPGTTAARMINDYGTLLEGRGLWAEAETAYREAWSIYRDVLGEEHPFTAIVLGNVGASRRARGDLEEAERLLRRSLELLREAWSDSHPTVAGARVRVAEVLMDRGRVPDAEPLLREGLAALEAALSDDHWRVAAARVRMARCLTALRRYEEAEALLRAGHRALAPVRDIRPREWREAVLRLAELHEARGNLEEATRYHAILGALDRG